MFDIGFPRDWSSLKKLIWLKAAISGGGASAVWKTVTGALIHITDALASPMQKCEVTLEPIQDLHGQDAPYPAGGGEQLINPNVYDATFTDTNGITIINNGDGTFTLKGTATATSYIKIANYKYLSAWGFFEPDTSYTISGYYNAGVCFGFGIYGSGLDYFAAENGTTMSFTSEQISTNQYRMLIKVNNGTVLGTTGIVLKPMICKSSVPNPATFAPYENVCPITGWTGCEVTRTGENIWDLTVYDGGAYGMAVGTVLNLTKAPDSKQFVDNGDGSFSLTFGSAWSYATIMYPRKAGVQYYRYLKYMYQSGAFKATAGTLSKDFKVLTATHVNVYDQAEWYGELPISEEDVYDYIVLTNSSGSNVTLTVKNIYAIVSSSASDYEPYSGTTLSVTFPDGQTVYGGTVDLVSGVLTVKVESVDLGTLDWTYNSTRKYFSSSHLDNVRVPSTSVIVTDWALSSIYKASSPTRIYGDAESNNNCFAIFQAGYLGISNQSYTDASTFKTAMSGVQLVYELAEPIEIQLTPQEIRTLKGENNVWGDGNIEMTYKAQAS